MATVTTTRDIKVELDKHYEATKDYSNQRNEIAKGLLLNKMLTVYAMSGHPEHLEDNKRLKDIGEKRLKDVENRIEFHKLMIMLFKTFGAYINGRSEKRVLGLVAEKVKQAIQDILAGVEDLIPYGSDFYTEEEYRQISNNLMREYNTWSPLCDSSATSLIFPI
jgi:hypothetical protein